MDKKKLNDIKKQAVGKSLDKKIVQRKRERLQIEVSKINRRMSVVRWLNFLGCLIALGIFRTTFIRGGVKPEHLGLAGLICALFFVISIFINSKLKARINKVEEKARNDGFDLTLES